MTALSRLKEITELGQAVWVDNLTRQMIDDGALDEYIRVDGLSGVTSNPTTFNKAMKDSDRYDAKIREIAEQNDDPEQIFLQTAFHDVRDAADMLRDIWRSTEGRDGLVSFELPPGLAYDSAASIAVANDVVKQIGRDTVNTMKEETLGMARNDARARPAIEETVDAFVQSYEAAVKAVETKAEL